MEVYGRPRDPVAMLPKPRTSLVTPKGDMLVGYARARDPFTTFTKPSISLITLSGILCLLNVHFRSDDLSVHSLYISFTTFTPYVPNGTH